MIAATSVVEFDEFDRTGRVVALSSAEAVALSSTGLLEVLPARTGRWRLVPNGSVGSVRIGGRSISVLPHADLGLSQLFFLLDYAPGAAFLKSSIGASTTDDLWTSMARALIALAEPELSRGLLRGYRRVDDALTTVRGRIRISDQLRRRPGITIPLEVSYSEFTPNIPENQILHTALHRLQFLPGMADPVRRQLAQLSFRLADAELIGHGRPIPEWSPSRLNARFHDALVLAERIVRRVWLDVDPDSESSALAAFVTQMPTLFERFVADVLSDAVDAPGEDLLRDPVANLEESVPLIDVDPGGSTAAATSGGKRKRGDVNAATPARFADTAVLHPVGPSPDGPRSAGSRSDGPRHASARDADLISVRTGLVYVRQDVPVATFVPSYPSSDTGDLADHYRILAACTALGVRHAYLVYPADRRGAVARPRRIVHTDISITEYPVDLAAGPEAARLALSALAAEARTLEPESAARKRANRRKHAK